MRFYWKYLLDEMENFWWLFSFKIMSNEWIQEMNRKFEINDLENLYELIRTTFPILTSPLKETEIKLETKIENENLSKL